MDNNLKEVLKILSILVPEWNAKFFKNKKTYLIN